MNDLLAKLQEVLGPSYRVDRELGGAGMSRVFLAHELELGRQVVVKVLPPDLAAGLNADRFRREIQLAAQLQHPHIVPLLSAGAKGGLLYYTMPFITGENLRARLVRMRELPVADATKILREVADALEYAHEQGVVHRDIKPENILFSGNHALVTDFGVSKALSSATSETKVSDAPALTSLGIALGTPTYMAPEQAAADPHIDHRADVYALGIVGYEILAGRPPFTGMTPQQVLSAQVTATPEPLSQHRPNLPPLLASLIMRCLEKRPADRWQSAGEMRTQLETVFTPSGATQPVASGNVNATSPRGTPSSMPRRVIIAAAVAGIVAAGLLLSTIALRKDELGFTIGATHQITNLPGVEVYPAVSPDGKMVAYVQNLGGKGQIFLRQISGGRAVAITDSSTDAFWPKWNPDGSGFLYTADGTLFVMPSLGGTPTALLPQSPTASYAYCDWSPSGGAIICANRTDGALYRLDPTGRNLKRLTKPSADIAHSVAWSPDGKRIAYVSGNVDFVDWKALGNLAASAIWVMPSDGGEPVRITDVAHLNMSPVWGPDGRHVLFVSTLGGPRDIYSQEVSSDASPKGAPIRLTTGLNPHTMSLSGGGHSIAYSAFTTTSNIWRGDIHGADPVSAASFKQVTFGNQTTEQVALSADGQWLAFDSNINGNSDIFKLAVAGGEPFQLTRDPADDFAPSWSPDGKEVEFHSFRNGNRDIFSVTSDGSRTETIVATPSQELIGSWFPDSKSMAYWAYPDSLFVVSRSASGWGKPRFLNKLGAAELVSPDGKWVAFAGHPGLTVAAIEGAPENLPTGLGPDRVLAPSVFRAGAGGAAGGRAWSRDSRLLYVSPLLPDGSSSLIVVPVPDGKPKVLYRFTDPLRQLYRGAIAVGEQQFYFVLGARESDIWVMDLIWK